MAEAIARGRSWIGTAHSQNGSGQYFRGEAGIDCVDKRGALEFASCYGVNLALAGFVFGFGQLRWGREGGGSDAIFFHPPVEGAAAEAEGFCRLAHVAVAAGERFADEDTLDGFEGHFFEGLGGDAGRG